MRGKIRILVLSCERNRTREATEILRGLEEGTYARKFQVHHHSATSRDLQKLLLKYEPHIVHFTWTTHCSRTDNERAFANLFSLYNSHVRLVVFNSSLTSDVARITSEVINYSIGSCHSTSQILHLTFAGAFYRALAFGRSIRVAFESAKAELALMTLPDAAAVELLVRTGVSEKDRFPQLAKRTRRAQLRPRCCRLQKRSRVAGGSRSTRREQGLQSS